MDKDYNTYTLITREKQKETETKHQDGLGAKQLLLSADLLSTPQCQQTRFTKHTCIPLYYRKLLGQTCNEQVTSSPHWYLTAAPSCVWDRQSDLFPDVSHNISIIALKITRAPTNLTAFKMANRFMYVRPPGANLQAVKPHIKATSILVSFQKLFETNLYQNFPTKYT